MTPDVVYLDAAATTPVRSEVLEAMWPFLAGGEAGAFGNPSSAHPVGEQAADAVRAARASIAARLGCRPSEVVVTSGGTEADNLAIKGIALAEPRGRHVIVSAIEHEAVLASAEQLQRLHGFDLTLLPVDAVGRVDPGELAAALRTGTTLVSVLHASNEVGTVQPIRELAAIARRTGVPFHTDAVQSAGALVVGLEALGVDALSVAGHKLGGPKGVGVLAIRSAIPLEPLVSGGGQERGRRSGTENVAGIVGLATALELARPELDAPALVAARDALIDGVLARIPDAVLTGARHDRLPNHASFCFAGASGEAVLLELGERGIVCSSGSACAAGRDEPSPVLLALGLSPELARTAVRFSFAAPLAPERVAELVDVTARAVATVRGLAA